MESRKKKAGLILSGIGVFIHFLWGSIFLFLLLPTPIFHSVFILFIGTISLLGIIIGVKEIKAGGVVIIVSIPVSIVYMLILNFFLESIPDYLSVDLIQGVVYIFLSPISLLIIIGGILCLNGFDD